MSRSVARKFSQLNPDAPTESELRESYGSFKSCGWRFCELLTRAAKTEAWRDWGAKSLAHWAEENLGLGKVTVSRLLKTGAVIAELPAADQERWRSVPVWTAADLADLAKKDPEAAYDIASDPNLTSAQMRQRAREKQPEQHHETSELRTIRAVVSEATRLDWQRALNVLRYEADEHSPSDDTLIKAAAQAVLQQPLGESERHRLAIEAGEIRCAHCGSWRASDLRRVDAVVKCAACAGQDSR